MTLKECISQVQQMRAPAVEAPRIINSIQRIEQRVKKEIIDAAADGDSYTFTDYTAASPEDTVLLAPDPYSEIYVWGCIYAIDLLRNNATNTNNSYAMFTDAWDRFAAYWRRNHIPPENKLHSDIYDI